MTKKNQKLEKPKQRTRLKQGIAKKRKLNIKIKTHSWCKCNIMVTIQTIHTMLPNQGEMVWKTKEEFKKV